MSLRSCLAALAAFLCLAVLPAPPARAQQTTSSNTVLGEVRFDGNTKIDKTSGVWIDGQYLGYVSELKGDKKVLLMPGVHQISVRQSGYENSDQKLTIEPGQVYTVMVKMERDPKVKYSHVTSEIKLAVTPERAAVFVDDVFVGHVSEFGGTGRAMLVSPGLPQNQNHATGLPDFRNGRNPAPQAEIRSKNRASQRQHSRRRPRH